MLQNKKNLFENKDLHLVFIKFNNQMQSDRTQLTQYH